MHTLFFLLCHLQQCSRCAAWFCSPSSSSSGSRWGCTTSLTGAMAWLGDPPSSPLEEPSSTASTPRTMKTTTKKCKSRAINSDYISIQCAAIVRNFLLHGAQQLSRKIEKNKNVHLYLLASGLKRSPRIWYCELIVSKTVQAPLSSFSSQICLHKRNAKQSLMWGSLSPLR